MVKKVNKKKLEQSILKLNPTELNQLITAYNKKHSTNIKNSKSTISEVEKLLLKDELSCPYCKNVDIKKNGFIKESGLQRYKCRSCNKTFNILSNTFIDKSPSLLTSGY